MRRLRSESGLSLIEVSVMLVASMAVLAALAPILSATLADVRRTRAITDLERIRDGIQNFLNDGFTRLTQNGTQVVAQRMVLLVTDGDIPQAGLTNNEWRTAAGTTAAYGFLEEHLVLNSFNGGNSYPTTSPNWRGAYLDAPIDPDPWGNRYGVNVQYLGGGSGGSNDVVVLSAGPDEEIDSQFTADPLSTASGTVADDDLYVLVES